MQRLIRWLIPLLLALLLMCAMTFGLSSRQLTNSYWEDGSYASLAVGRQLAAGNGFCLVSQQRIPLTRDALWQVLLAGLIVIFRGDQGLLVMLGLLCALGTILLLLRMARLLFPFPPFVVFSACALAAVPGFLSSVLQGSSLSLGMLLITGAGLLHVEALQGRRAVLPLSAALLIGLAACLRVESALWWFVLTLHAALFSFWSKGRFSLGEVLLRSLSGLMMIAVCLFPLVAWNVKFFSVPWPQIPGASLTANAWGHMHPAAVVQEGLMTSAGAFWAVFRLWSDIPFPGSFSGWLAFVFGCGVLLSIAVLRDEEKPYTLIPFTVLVLPVLSLLITPYTGMSSFAWVFATALPMMLLLSVFGLFRIPFFVEELYRRWKEGLPSAFGFKIWWGVSGSVFAIWLLVSCYGMTRRYYDQLAIREARRHETARVWVTQADRNVLATDQPGWSARFLRPGALVDLTGWYSPEVLSMSEKDALSLFLKQRGVSQVLILEQGEDGSELLKLSPLDYVDEPL